MKITIAQSNVQSAISSIIPTTFLIVINNFRYKKLLQSGFKLYSLNIWYGKDSICEKVSLLHYREMVNVKCNMSKNMWQSTKIM